MKKGLILIIIIAVLVLLVFSFISLKKKSVSFGKEINYGAGFRTAETIGEVTDTNVFDTKTNPFEESEG